MGMTIVQKILARATGRASVEIGDVLEPAVDLAMSHENAALVINQFLEVYKGTGLEPRIWDPGRLAIIFDHRVPAETSKTATNQKKVRDFVGAQGITRFHDIRGDQGGICHQILPENGYVLPGTVVVGTDSHTTSHGALGAFAFGIGATEMAGVWALGFVFNVEVPRTMKVVVNGALPAGVEPKDLILHLIGRISNQGANFKVIEFHGEASGACRRRAASRSATWPSKPARRRASSPADEETVRYLREVAGVTGELRLVTPDPDAGVLRRRRDRRVVSLVPQIACPHTVDNVKPVTAVAGTKVHQIVIGSCTNGRLDDLESAATHPQGPPRRRAASACSCSRPRGASTRTRCGSAISAT